MVLQSIGGVMPNRLKIMLVTAIVAVLQAAVPSVLPAQSAIFVPSAKPVKNMQRALHNPEVFCLLIRYDADSPEFAVSDLDLLDSAYRIGFAIGNPNYYTMTIEGYGTADEELTRRRVDAVYRYFAMRGGEAFPVRMAHNRIHCSCKGDTVETLRFEVPVSTAVYDVSLLPEARRVVNGTVRLDGSVLVTFRNDPDECVGAARGCFVPKADSIVHGYYASLAITRGAVYAVEGTKDTCPNDLEIGIADHLDYKQIVERYALVPHRKQLIVQAGYIVLSSNWAQNADSCPLPQKDSIYLRIPATEEQIAAKLKFFAKVRTAKGVEYKQLPTRKSGGKLTPMLQAPLNISQFDTVYVGKRIQPSELKKYFYPVDGPTEAAAFKAGDGWWVAYRPGKRGEYELKKPLRDLFRIIPEQEEEQPDSRGRLTNPEEIID